MTSGDCVKYFVGLCNKFEKYKQSDISMVRQIMGVHSLTSIIDLKRDRFSSVRNTRRQSREFNSSGNSSDNRESDSRDSRSRSRSGGSSSGSGSSGDSRETSDKSKTSSSQVYEFLMQ